MFTKCLGYEILELLFGPPQKVFVHPCPRAVVLNLG